MITARGSSIAPGCRVPCCFRPLDTAAIPHVTVMLRGGHRLRGDRRRLRRGSSASTSAPNGRDRPTPASHGPCQDVAPTTSSHASTSILATQPARRHLAHVSRRGGDSHRRGIEVANHECLTNGCNGTFGFDPRTVEQDDLEWCVSETWQHRHIWTEHTWRIDVGQIRHKYASAD